MIVYPMVGPLGTGTIFYFNDKALSNATEEGLPGKVFIDNRVMVLHVTTFQMPHLFQFCFYASGKSLAIV